MGTIIGLLSFSLSLFSSVAASASPQSIGSDISIVTHNDLYGNATVRRAAAVALSTPTSYAAAASRCAVLGTVLWSRESNNQDLGFLRYLDHSKTTDEVGTYWIEGNSTLHCRAITTEGGLKTYPCSTQLPALCSNTATDAVRHISVTTNNATIIGYRDKQSFRFLGLRYATIPARFEHSVYLQPLVNATALQYGPTCLQSSCTTSCSEDCLSLNIWTPYLPNGKVTPRKKKAVMVWIHGGGFASGAGSDTTFDGSALASRGDVVAVTINYRLGTLGFLALENTVLTGNYGLQDQNTALDWLHAHIEDFGGDKNRVTLYGQSAGAASVRALLASPKAQEKVSGAIMMSTPQGLGYADTFARYLTVAVATERTKAIANETGCSTQGDLVACLRTIDPLQFVTRGKTVATFPVVDGTFLPTSSLPLGPSAPKLRVSVLLGNMRDDGSPFTSYPTSPNISAVLSAQGFPASAILSSSAFPIPSNPNSTLAIFNLTSRIATDAMFRCLGQSTAYTAAKNNVFKKVYAYEFDRAYQIAEWSPNPPACEAPVTPGHPFGDPDAPFYKCHSGELYSVFGTTVSQGRTPRDQDDIPFSQYIVDTWSAFARTGNPVPDARFLKARGFTNTSRYVREAGPWNEVSETKSPVRVLDTVVRNSAWREAEQCNVLGQGLEYYNTA
ncbi:alpha/beta-hydrolase [Ophiobolus disseminans]|uniref:Carboxylic ester hydrolase n=1 Tax=Ophiobolus disseminans TaxID=1469910 RepID=A0A6A6ZVB7_9PLEO|nr:alpha/beta-hydrolase [Ophiobolus disseminans]